MGVFGRNRDVHVSYDEDKVNPEDVDELRQEMAETYREKPETYRGKKRLTIIHAGMLDANLKLIGKKIKRTAIKMKDKISRKETPSETIRRLEEEIAELEDKLRSGNAP